MLYPSIWQTFPAAVKHFQKIVFHANEPANQSTNRYSATRNLLPRLERSTALWQRSVICSQLPSRARLRSRVPLHGFQNQLALVRQQGALPRPNRCSCSANRRQVGFRAQRLRSKQPSDGGMFQRRWRQLDCRLERIVEHHPNVRSMASLEQRCI